MKRVLVMLLGSLLMAGSLSLAFAQAPTGEAKKEEVAPLTPGLYSCELTNVEFTEEEDGFTGTGNVKLQMDLKADGAFSVDQYLSSKEAKLTDGLFYKVMGKWRQEGESLISYEQQEQTYKFDTQSLSPWAPLTGERTTETVKIGNVTKNSFQEYDEKGKKWLTWTKM